MNSYYVVFAWCQFDGEEPLDKVVFKGSKFEDAKRAAQNAKHEVCTMGWRESDAYDSVIIWDVVRGSKTIVK